MDSDSGVGARLRASGWRQGSLVPASVCNHLDLARPEGAMLAVVVSQDCDVVAPVDVEADIELIAATDVEVPDPATLHGKLPRKLTLPLVNSPRYLELSVRHRTFVPKAQLLECTPDSDSRLSNDDVRTLARWLGKRYTRDAFPDTFNTRLSSARGKLERLSKSDLGKAVATILVSIEHGNVELPENEPYRIVLWFVLRSGNLNPVILTTHAAITVAVRRRSSSRYPAARLEQPWQNPLDIHGKIGLTLRPACHWSSPCDLCQCLR